MQEPLKFQLNGDELRKLCASKGWGYGELAEFTGLSREQIWKMSLEPTNPQFSTVGLKSRKALRKAFPRCDALFLPISSR
jgi:predicted transcriptional regulator